MLYSSLKRGIKNELELNWGCCIMKCNKNNKKNIELYLLISKKALSLQR